MIRIIMNIIKFIGGFFSIILGILILYWNRIESKKNSNNSDGSVYDNPIDKSIDFQGYILVLILVCTGMGLIVSAFHD